MIKGKKFLFAGHYDQGKLEGGMIEYQGTFTLEEAKPYVEHGDFDWAQLAEERFGELHVVAFLNDDYTDGWMIPMEVDIGSNTSEDLV